MRVKIRASQTGIREVGFKVHRHRSSNGERFSQGWRQIADEELRAYFSGCLRSFTVPCDLSELPPFTQAVLRVTASIPYGEVRSYRWVASQLGKPEATRAVGNALARNPISILIPCHRVVRSDGSLGGYSLGVHWKRKLLRHEQNHNLGLRSQRRPKPALRGFPPG
jgi:O-6-methylguanine DNA methyltransferase